MGTVEYAVGCVGVGRTGLDGAGGIATDDDAVTEVAGVSTGATVRLNENILGFAFFAAAAAATVSASVWLSAMARKHCVITSRASAARSASGAGSGGTRLSASNGSLP